MEGKLGRATHYLHKEVLARTAGAMMAGVSSGGGVHSSYEVSLPRPTPVVRTMEAMGIQSSQRIVAELYNVDEIRLDFDGTLGLDTSQKLLSWDAVKSRNRFEQCLTAQDQEDWRYNEHKEITSMLRERYNCLENPMDFFIDSDGKLRSSDFPTEPLETVLRRGVAYQETHGSQEITRERSEVQGILSIQQDFNRPDAEDGETRCIISGPGLVEDSPYTKPFFDKYTLRIDPDTGERRVEAKRFATIMDYEDNKQLALAIDPHYFDGTEGPIDAIFLRKPLNLDGFADADDLLEKMLLLDPEAMRGSAFKLIDSICDPIENELIQEVIHWNPVLIARTLNSLLHLGDEIKEAIDRGDSERLRQLYEWSQQLTQEELHREIASRGSQPVATLAVGCGESGGLFGNSVGMFGFDAENDPNLCKQCVGVGPHFHCPGALLVEKTDKEGKKFNELEPCKEAIRVGKGIKYCLKCKQGKTC
ncbi:MAG TPA: hypothetical protein VG935_03615 [Patescibacteria group bacterium]|nr:hypothetical protein [Patescibacteria group bacterium]